MTDVPLDLPITLRDPGADAGEPFEERPPAAPNPRRGRPISHRWFRGRRVTDEAAHGARLPLAATATAEPCATADRVSVDGGAEVLCCAEPVPAGLHLGSTRWEPWS